MDVVDGNAIGGLLIDVFGTEMTAAGSTCATCGATRPVAQLVVYQQAPGTVVRCRTCGSVLMVFVTAHDQYAIQAFEINALDYLLKPVIEERFVKALVRAKSRICSSVAADSSRQVIGLLETIASPRSYVKRLAVRSGGKTVFVDVEDVDWIGAAENYVELHAGRVSHLLHVTMNTLEKSLDPQIFLRIHRSIIVNLVRIKNLESGAHGEYVITLRDGARLQSGRAFSSRLRALINNPF